LNIDREIHEAQRNFRRDMKLGFFKLAGGERANARMGRG
jgi:hypothetical protein